MKDFLGSELNVGDEVVYIERFNGGSRLALGKERYVNSKTAQLI